MSTLVRRAVVLKRLMLGAFAPALVLVAASAVEAAAACPALSARVAANTTKKIEVLTITAQPCVIKLMLYDAANAQAEEPLRPSIARRPQYGTAEVAGRELVYTVASDFRGRAAFTVNVEGIGEPVTVVVQATEWTSTEKE